jgi:DNA polymerase-3 subunit delta'
LEEPPGETVLLLTTARREQLLPTIVSRCQTIHCEPLTDEEIARALIERDGVSQEESAIIAKAANGSFRVARELSSEDMLQVRQDAIQFLRYSLGGSRVDLLAHMVSAFGGGDRPSAGQRLRVLQSWLHEEILLRAKGEDHANGNEDLKRFVGRFPHADLIRASEAVDRSIALLDRNVYLPLILTTLALDLQRCIASPTS